MIYIAIILGGLIAGLLLVEIVRITIDLIKHRKK